MQKEYWDKFVLVHSPATCEYVKTILGKEVTEAEVVKAHQTTCQSKTLSASNCGKGLYTFLIKYGYVNTDATAR